jgi:transcriptional regulator with XRE-family HTH domain
MNTKESVAKRVRTLCREKGIAVNALAKAAGITPSTAYSILNQKSKNPGIVTIQKLCDGLGVSLQSFFDSKMFK